MALAAGLLRGEGELPDGYTRVEYIEPKGVGEYIDTEFCPTTNTCIAAEFTALPQTDENGVLFGVSDGKEIQDEEGNVIEDPSSSVLPVTTAGRVISTAGSATPTLRRR